MERAVWGVLIRSVAGASTLVALAGCASDLDVRESVTPLQAEKLQTERYRARTFVRGTESRPIPDGATVKDGTIVASSDERVRLANGDTVVTNEAGNVLQLKGPDGKIKRAFLPGRAKLTRDYIEVQGGEATVLERLLPTDKIEMGGVFQVGESVPGGGKVDTTRATWALVTGIVVFSLSYAPAAIVGAGSKLKDDRLLFIPLAGPWIDFIVRPKCKAPEVPAGVTLPVDPCVADQGARVALVTSGIGQGLGAILTVIGIPTQAVLAKEGVHAVRPVIGPNHIGIAGSF